MRKINTTDAFNCVSSIAFAYRTIEGERLPPEVIALLDPADTIALDNGRCLVVKQASTDDRGSILPGVYELHEVEGQEVLRAWILTSRGVLRPKGLADAIRETRKVG